MGDPGYTSGAARKTCEFRFSNNFRPTLRTPCGEERLARTSKVFSRQSSGGQRFERLAAKRDWRVLEQYFRGGRATARLYRLKPAPPLLRRNAETPDLEKYFRGKQLAANASNALRRGEIGATSKSLDKSVETADMSVRATNIFEVAEGRDPK